MALIIGIFTGFLICIPVGPINVWVVNTLIRHNFRSAFSIALGGSLMDFIYFMVILSGLSFFHFSFKTILVLKIIGVLFLFLFGLKEFLVKKQDFSLKDEMKKKAPHTASFFLMGVAIYSSNPTLVASMSAIAAVIKSWNLFSETYFNYFALSLGLAVGTASWFYILLKIVSKYQYQIPEKFFINFSRVSGALIVLFSLYMAFNVYKENFI
jgi:threonine/homoserine/homoserine lactone efflux protein